MDEHIDHEMLAKAARECAALRRAEAAATWVGDGRQVTAKGVLRGHDLPDAGRALSVELPDHVRSAADVPDLHTPWITALAAGLLSINGKQVIPGHAATNWPPTTEKDLLDIWMLGLAACLQDTFPDDGDGTESLEVGRFVLTALTTNRAQTRDDLLGVVSGLMIDARASSYRTFNRGFGVRLPSDVALDLLVAFGAADPESQCPRITELGRFALSAISARGQSLLQTSARDPIEGICQLKITLRHVRPVCWRRVLVPASATLADLHEIIQVAFAWDDDHLHRFMVGRRSYGDPAFDFEHDETTAALGTVLTRRPTISYTYDFGDSWLHEIVLEQAVAVEPAGTYPLCVDGRGDAPVEDWCEGEPEWIPFDRAEINERLARRGSPDRSAQLQIHDDIEVILTDAYGAAEEMTAFYTVLDEEIDFPVLATLLGNPVLVTGLDEDEATCELRARCRSGRQSADVSFADLEFRPATVEAWLQAAYLAHLGGRPPAVARPPGWDGLTRWMA